MLTGRIEAFVRDDDAGWDDDRLHALLDVTARAAVPIDLAAIPEAVTPALARSLLARGGRGLVAVHQHGLAHANHEPQGRRCEFGPSRDGDAQRRDIAQGRARLQDLFGEALQPWFTPPWNRCAAHTPAILAELGFGALSRSRGAAPAQHALPELAVDIDWSRCWREGGPSALQAAFERTLAERRADGRPLGLMLHHAVMGDEERRALAALLETSSRDGHVRWRPMAALVGARDGGNALRPCASAT